MPNMADHIDVGGGPLAGAHHGPMAWSITATHPPAFCVTENDVWHHYVLTPGQDPAGPPAYTYAGLCANVNHAFGDPSTHIQDDAEQPAVEPVGGQP